MHRVAGVSHTGRSCVAGHTGCVAGHTGCVEWALSGHHTGKCSSANATGYVSGSLSRRRSYIHLHIGFEFGLRSRIGLRLRLAFGFEVCRGMVGDSYGGLGQG